MIGNYPLHLMILVLLWGYIYTSWSLMGRLGLVSFGHGAFMGIGAYTVVMLWNHFGWSPWAGALAALAFAASVAILIGYPCFRFKIVGHYFALVTLALSEVARLVIVALRDQTGGSLGATPNSALHGGATAAPGALQFSGKQGWVWIVLAFWLAGLWGGADGRRGVHAAARRRAAPRLRQPLPGARQHALRRDAGAVHHLHAEGHPRRRARGLAREDEVSSVHMSEQDAVALTRALLRFETV